jgi:hypothetical protein
MLDEPSGLRYDYSERLHADYYKDFLPSHLHRPLLSFSCRGKIISGSPTNRAALGRIGMCAIVGATRSQDLSDSRDVPVQDSRTLRQ